MKLSTLQLLILYWAMDGRSYLEIAEIEDLPRAKVLEEIESLLKSLDVKTLDHAITLAQRRDEI